MISVIIPVLNECNTIGSVVEFARRDPKVREVIVVDDGSIDGTPEMAAAAGRGHGQTHVFNGDVSC